MKKHIYGIDLGTTYSLCALNGKVLTGLVPSAIDVETRKTIEEKTASGVVDVKASYKTDMSMSSSGDVARKCSTFVLQEIRDRVKRIHGLDVEDVVISVPAYFTTSQREAVYESAKEAGLNVKRVINEPTAAAIAVSSCTPDLYIVYDLGGGTFDVSLLDSRTGDYCTVATDGTILGGDDLDLAIVREFLKENKIPVRFKSKTVSRLLKAECRVAKESMTPEHTSALISINVGGEDYSYNLTRDRYEELVVETFYKTVEMTKFLLAINSGLLDKEPVMVLVGGSTRNEILINYLKTQFSELKFLPVNFNPDYVIAEGASIYANLLENGTAGELVSDVTKRLVIDDGTGRGIEVFESNTILPASVEVYVSNKDKSNTLKLSFYQGNSLTVTNNEFIGEMVFDYGKVYDKGEAHNLIGVSASVDGVIHLQVRDMFTGKVSEAILSRV